MRYLQVAVTLTLCIACSRAKTADPAPSGMVPFPARTDSSAARVYFEFQVTKPVKPTAVMKGPAYPAELRTARTEGEVLAQFIVDTLGRPEMASFKVLRSSHDLFTRSVKEAVVWFQYLPAEINGSRVRQLVQQPFYFHLYP